MIFKASEDTCHSAVRMCSMPAHSGFEHFVICRLDSSRLFVFHVVGIGKARYDAALELVVLAGLR